MDEWHTPEQTVSAAAKEAVRRRVPVIIGTVKNEMQAFILQRDPETKHKMREIQTLRYDDPADQFAVRVAKGGVPVRRYFFTWSAPESNFGACHCIELPFVFGNLDAWNAPMLQGASKEEMARLRETIQPLWCDFFRAEEIDREIWPLFTEEVPAVKYFDNLKNPVLINQ